MYLIFVATIFLRAIFKKSLSFILKHVFLTIHVNAFLPYSYQMKHSWGAQKIELYLCTSYFIIFPFKMKKNSLKIFLSWWRNIKADHDGPEDGLRRDAGYRIASPLKATCRQYHHETKSLHVDEKIPQWFL